MYAAETDVLWLDPARVKAYTFFLFHTRERKERCKIFYWALICLSAARDSHAMPTRCQLLHVSPSSRSKLPSNYRFNFWFSLEQEVLSLYFTENSSKQSGFLSKTALIQRAFFLKSTCNRALIPFFVVFGSLSKHCSWSRQKIHVPLFRRWFCSW